MYLYIIKYFFLSVSINVLWTNMNMNISIN